MSAGLERQAQTCGQTPKRRRDWLTFFGPAEKNEAVLQPNGERACDRDACPTSEVPVAYPPPAPPTIFLAVGVVMPTNAVPTALIRGLRSVEAPVSAPSARGWSCCAATCRGIRQTIALTAASVMNALLLTDRISLLRRDRLVAAGCPDMVMGVLTLG